jgi:outer membrane receptor protein involved in Fe transport
MTNRQSLFRGLALTVPALIFSAAASAAEAIEEILVTADFRRAPVMDYAASISVLDSEQIASRTARHLAEVFSLAPNVNYASGASRGRFFQIRGIGERSQFVEPVNPSVGLIVDGIDLTGIGGAATTLDIQQVEILRGPQGTLYGANALAGLINMVSGAPTETFYGRVETTLAEYDTKTVSAVVSGPFNETLGYRVAIQQHNSDGYIDNVHLDREDTDNLDELTARGRLRWQPREDLQVDFSALYVDVDNGYDAFSLDNTRETLSDEPGHDRLETLAGSMRVQWRASEDYRLIALLSHADSDSEYGFDEDWSFEGICDVFDCVFPGYSSFDNYLRENRNTSVDLRYVSDNEPEETGWVLGLYYRDQQEDLRREYSFLSEDFLSDFDSRNAAVYGQVEYPLTGDLTLVTGLRYEQREAEYSDSDGAEFSPRENMWGGRLALEYYTAGDTLVYGLISRGYKAGGFNSNQSLPVADREFDTENLWNYEIGVKGSWWEDRLSAQLALFYQDREDVQTRQSVVEPNEGDICPCEFIDYTTNAAAGSSQGLEAELNWRATEQVRVYASLGLLESEFEDFESFAHVGADPETGTPFDLGGRDLPHAPNYQYALGTVIQMTEHWYARLEVEGKDEFYFSSRHGARADAYELFNARLGYRGNNWHLVLWGRNLTDRDYQVRGFGSFGNDPRKGYATEPYYQLGDPRVVGVTASYEFQ